MKRKAEYGRLATLIDNIVEEMVMETPTADAILIPRDATNGDMIKAMFPNIDIRLFTDANIVQTKIQEFDSYWWNAPYIPQK